MAHRREVDGTPEVMGLRLNASMIEQKKKKKKEVMGRKIRGVLDEILLLRTGTSVDAIIPIIEWSKCTARNKGLGAYTAHHSDIKVPSKLSCFFAVTVDVSGRKDLWVETVAIHDVQPTKRQPFSPGLNKPRSLLTYYISLVHD